MPVAVLHQLARFHCQDQSDPVPSLPNSCEVIVRHGYLPRLGGLHRKCEWREAA